MPMTWRPSGYSPTRPPSPSDSRAEEFAARVEEDATHQRALELACLVGEISLPGEQEAEACRAILQDFADYLRSRPANSDELMGDFG